MSGSRVESRLQRSLSLYMSGSKPQEMPSRRKGMLSLVLQATMRECVFNAAGAISEIVRDHRVGIEMLSPIYTRCSCCDKVLSSGTDNLQPCSLK